MAKSKKNANKAMTIVVFVSCNVTNAISKLLIGI